MSIISKQSQVNILRNRIMKKTEWVFNYDIQLDHKEYVVKVMRSEENPLIRLIDAREWTVQNGESIEVCSRFTNAFLKLEVSKRRAAGVKLGLYAVDNGDGAAKFYFRAGRLYQDIVTGDKVTELPVSAMKYVIYATSPAGVRRNTVFMINVTQGIEVAEELLDIVTHGGYLLRKGNPMTAATGIKLEGRHSQWQAPSKNIGKLDRIAIMDGEYLDEKNNKFMDGMAFVRAKFIARVFGLILGCHVSERVVLGMGIQARPSGLVKAFFVVVDDEFMNLVANRFPYVQYGGPGVPDVLVDRNALKDDYDFERDVEFEVLDIAKSSDAHTSVQMLQKLVGGGIVRKEVVALLRGLFRRNFDESFDRLAKDEASVPSLSMFKGDNVFVPMVAASVAPWFVMHDRNVFRKMAGNIIEGEVNDANKLYYKLDGMSGRLVVDIASLFAAPRVLKYGEVFLGGSGYAGQQVCLFKYPTVGVREFYLARALGLSEIIDRIGLIDNVQARRALVKYYTTLAAGMICLPAEEMLKKQLAGCDFDYDGAVVVAEPEFIRLISQIEPLIVNITTDAKSAPKQIGAYGLDLIGDVVLTQICQAGAGIGEITIQDDIVIALMTAPYEQVERILSQIFGHDPKIDYLGLTYDTVTLDGVVVPHVAVSPKDVAQIAYEISVCHWSPEVMPQILQDLNVCFRLLQEMTIDAAKTGDCVDSPIASLLKVATVKVRQWTPISIDWNQVPNAQIENKEGVC